jgi:hypothetical protein
MIAMEEARKIMEDRDMHEAFQDFLIQKDPEFIIENIGKGIVPKYVVDLFLVLTKLYDKGYTDANDDLEEHK